MSRKSVQPQTPEERELERKTAELSALEAELAQRELSLATLQNELDALEAQYLRAVGGLYAELDELEAQIAEALAQTQPSDQGLRDQAQNARSKATESFGSVGIAEQLNSGIDLKPTDQLKELYREIARHVHPDLTTDETERARRNHLMTVANRAYRDGDETKLRGILDEWVSNPGLVQGDGVAAELVRTIRKIHQVERRLEEIKTEIAGLESSDLHALRALLRLAVDQGRDLFAEMAEELRQEIGVARTRLSRSRAEAAP